MTQNVESLNELDALLTDAGDNLVLLNIESQEECDLGNNPDAWQLGAHEASTHVSMQARTPAPSRYHWRGAADHDRCRRRRRTARPNPARTFCPGGGVQGLHAPRRPDGHLLTQLWVLGVSGRASCPAERESPAVVALSLPACVASLDSRYGWSALRAVREVWCGVEGRRVALLLLTHASVWGVRRRASRSRTTWRVWRASARILCSSTSMPPRARARQWPRSSAPHASLRSSITRTVRWCGRCARHVSLPPPSSLPLAPRCCPVSVRRTRRRPLCEEGAQLPSQSVCVVAEGACPVYVQHVGAGSETMQSVGESVLYYGGVAGGGVSSSDYITEVNGPADLTDFLDSCAMPTVNPAVSNPVSASPDPPCTSLHLSSACTVERDWSTCMVPLQLMRLSSSHEDDVSSTSHAPP
jgi:hypothetical protein